MNGWMRLWVIVSGVWYISWIIGGFLEGWEYVKTIPIFGWVLILVFPFLVFISIVSVMSMIIWVYEGFRKE